MSAMKRTGICPKCGSRNVKENQFGGMNVQLAGRIYRCKDCGFSELWSTKSDRRQMTGRIVAFMIILAAIWGAFALYIL